MIFKLFSSDKLSLEGVYQKEDYRDYDHNFRLNPDGDYQRHRVGANLAMGYTRALSASSFVNAKVSGLFGTYEQYVYEDPYDSRYVNPQRLMQRPADTFYTGGTEMWHYNHETRTYVAKADYTNQVTNTHLIKAGLEGKLHRLWSHDFQIRFDAATAYKPAIPDPSATDNLEYIHHPVEAAFYIQDKMEFDYLIVNAGVRYDYFRPDDVYPENPDQLQSSSFVDASAKQQLSPRFGLAYPITDRGVIHVSYGHFFQLPPFDYLYTNPGFKIVVAGQLSTLQGNADLKPQQTTAYEVGLQQQLSDELALDVTMYYKDIRNLLSTEIHDYLNGAARFARYINRDYGNVKGITVALEKQFRNGLGATVDYTYQIARGNASDPQSVYLDNQTSPPRESTKQLVPLDWDRTHSLNFTVTVGSPDNYNISLIGRLGSGLPYTPSQSTYRMALENSESKPTVTSVDLYAYKVLTLLGSRVSVFLKVYNLFDTMNELNVFTDTGRSGSTLSMLYDPQPQGVNTLREYFTRPDFYSAPRQVILGFSFGL
jgi:outer membrane receptor protein involved in Fe transport